MNSPKSEFIADLLINVLIFEPDLPLYIGFMQSIIVLQPETEVKVVEVSDPSYKRQPVKFTEIIGNSVSVTHDIQFLPATKAWTSVTHFAIFDPDGNMLLLKNLGFISTVEVGQMLTINRHEFILFIGHNSSCVV